MSTTQIPPVNPAPPEPSTRPLAGDLYDAQHWVGAYTGSYGASTVIVQLQDELTHSGKREAFWISVVVHLLIVMVFVNLNRIGGWIPHRTAIVMNPNDKDKNLTYLELPADEQKVSKRPDTKIISDKDRIATSKAPQVNHDQLKKILDAGRTGRPGPIAPPAPSPAPQQAQPAPQPQAAPPPKPQEQMEAKLQSPPPTEAPKPSFDTSTRSAGSAIEQAARATTANRGGYGADSGDNGNYGQAPGRRATAATGPVEVLSDTMGVDFGPYLQRVVHDVRINWYNLIPESARAPLMKKGKVSIEFAITKDGKVAGMHYVDPTSGDVALDRAAYGGITASNPFPPLPSEFGGQYLGLRFTFYYNPDKNEMQ
ncbi:MAG TPA: TonB C-terminal domain-containing protein [Terriglobales bacterium]|jgi:TonB family protein|nr:TonB C-terminal domain-containing protein [Terriglobales bacterium]